ncbi:MAG TPA: phenylalanine--tRNA ligase subunit beta [Candidatus Binatia bacterium]
MKLTLNWLKEFVAFTGTPEELARLLTMAGLEVESLSSLREPDTNREDWLLEIAVTPNRGDCLGIAGIAREVSALTGAELKPMTTLPSKKNPQLEKRVAIQIEDAHLCPRYSARIVENLSITESPLWLRYRLEACGIRAINYVVDVTNYVMLETGQPLHAFDWDQLPEKRIVVRPARELRRFTTLDGATRDLAHDDLLICAGNTPVALAGVMGGSDTEVRASTSMILLESANFSSSSIRRTAKRLGMHSEASHRFERGVDPEGTIRALDRTVWLLRQIASGAQVSGVADEYPGRIEPRVVQLRAKRIAQLLGVQLELRDAERLLGALGLKVERRPKQRSLKITVPASRPDLTREADLIEELARLNGYDNIPTTLPPFRISAKLDTGLSWERKLRGLLNGEGMTEVINLPFVSEQLNSCFTGLWQETTLAPVTVLNPLAKENNEMRQSLVPGLLENLRFNVAQQCQGFRSYQLGKVFRLLPGGEPDEKLCLGGLLSGNRVRHGLHMRDDSSPGFLDGKGIVEAILDLFCLNSAVSWARASTRFLHPGKSAWVRYNEDDLGYVGEFHPDVAERFDASQVLVFELDFDKLLQYAPRRIAAKPLPRFPAVERDVAIVVDRDFAAQQVIGWIHDLGEPLIEHVEVFDQYVGAPIPNGKKSLAYRVSYRADDRTLIDSEVNELHQTLVDRLGKTFDAERRS